MARTRQSLVAAIVIGLATTAVARADADKGEPQFGFTEDVDVGDKGDRVIEFDSVTGLGKRSGRYAATSQSIAAEYTMLDNLRIAPHAAFSHHRVRGVPGMDDRIQSAFAGLAFETKYRLLDRSKAPFGLALVAAPYWQRVDQTSGEPVENYGLGLVVAAEKELIAERLYAAFNLSYDLAATRQRSTGIWEHGSSVGVSGSLSVPVRNGFFVGGEMRHERAYDGLALDRYAGHALFAGPHFNAKLAKNVSIVGAWNAQLAGRAADAPGALDLANFERHRVKIKLEVALGP
jgi:hypothetical protein